jgi:hypothetical protein
MIAFIRLFLIRFDQPLELEHSHPIASAKGEIVPGTNEYAIGIGWREVGSEIAELIQSKQAWTKFVESIDDEICGLRDVLYTKVGQYGFVRSMRIFNCEILTDEDDANYWSDFDSVNAATLVDERCQVLGDHVGSRGNRPSPIDPTAAMLLARAEAERERLPSVVAFTKVFESAFGTHNEGKLILALEKFFKKGTASYSKSEIRKWFNVRGEDAHASKRVAQLDNIKYDLLFARLRQAAIDVAYNKREWGEKRSLREKRVALNAWYDEVGKMHALSRRPIELVFRRDTIAGRLIDRRLSNEEISEIAKISSDFIETKIFKRSEGLRHISLFSISGKIQVRDFDRMSNWKDELIMTEVT